MECAHLLLGRVPTGHRLKEKGIVDVNGDPMCDQGRILISIYSYRAAGWWSFVDSYLFLFRSVLGASAINTLGKLRWGYSKNREVTVNSAYKLALDQLQEDYQVDQ
ncbi:hypothetical protein FRX31_026185, partial [Thalictrum thalictroides]